VGPALIINPAGDDEFVGHVRQEARDASTPDELQSRLRERYPQAVVRQRDLSDERRSIWYVYRDGRWTSGAR
jgi:uncharacterized iron-regulated membrane protein